MVLSRTSATHAEGSPEQRALKRRKSLELLKNLTLREVRSQYKRTALGRLWSFINPLVTIAIYSVVFSVIINLRHDPGRSSGLTSFAFFLAACLIPWNFLSGGIMAGMGSLTGNSGLLSKVYFPRWIPVVATVLSIATTFLFELGVLTVVVLIFGGPRVLIFLPAAVIFLILAVVFVTGVALALSIANVYFRDTQHIVTLFIQAWFYLTPIIYPITLVASLEGKIRAQGWSFPLTFLWGLNPAYRFTDAFRSIFYDFEWPTLNSLIGCVLAAVVSLMIGILVFRKHSARIVEEL